MLPLPPEFLPMEAQLAEALPAGDNWVYEPKWDGFRCLAFRDGAALEMRSKKGQALGRYFPELRDALLALRADRFVLDGEIVTVVNSVISFDALLQRIHPAESRIRKLSVDTPASFIVFDLLVDSAGESLVDQPLRKRRQALQTFARRFLEGQAVIELSPITEDFGAAMSWLDGGHAGIDGVMAKRADLPYLSGERLGMKKVKRMRTADCVVGGFRYAASGSVVGSLLLGLYNDAGLLDHVGFCAAFTGSQRVELTKMLEPFIGGAGFTGNAPGGPSRWSTERSTQWVPLRPELVVEVQYDHFSEGRFRHGTRLLRFRPDKAPRSCTMDQVAPVGVSKGPLLRAA